MSGLEVSQPTCRNCGVGVVGEFCSQCGQRHTDTLDGKDVIKTFFEAILNIQGPWRRTLVDLFIRPQVLIRDYLAGARKRYVHPVMLMLVVNTGYFLMVSLLGADIFYGMSDETIHGTTLSNLVESYAGYAALLLTWPVALLTGRLWPNTRAVDRYLALLYVQTLSIFFLMVLLPLGTYQSSWGLIVDNSVGLLATLYALRQIRPSIGKSLVSALLISLIYFFCVLLAGVVVGVAMAVFGIPWPA